MPEKKRNKYLKFDDVNTDNVYLVKDKEYDHYLILRSGYTFVHSHKYLVLVKIQAMNLSDMTEWKVTRENFNDCKFKLLYEDL